MSRSTIMISVIQIGVMRQYRIWLLEAKVKTVESPMHPAVPIKELSKSRARAFVTTAASTYIGCHEGRYVRFQLATATQRHLSRQ